MNYNVLFENALKQIPNIHSNDLNVYYSSAHYNYYDKSSTASHKEQLQNIPSNYYPKIYMPFGKKYIVWFCELNSQYYSFLIDISIDKKNNYNNPRHYPNKQTQTKEQTKTKTKDKIELNQRNIHFRYSCFKPELAIGDGTMILGTLHKNMFCCEKIIYLKGAKMHNSIYKDIELMKHILDNYIKNINFSYDDNNFLMYKIPYMDYSQNSILTCTNLDYKVHRIIQNYSQSIIKSFMCNFAIVMCDDMVDVYQLYCKKQNKLYKLSNAFVNDFKTSRFMLKYFDTNKYKKDYKSIELSDTEQDTSGIIELNNDDHDVDVGVNHNYENDVKQKSRIFSCVFIPNIMKWKPYQYIGYFNDNQYKIDSFDKIKHISSMKLNY